jgi:photosystem II stability/assembly factor-like uncharacterized protein
MVVARASGIALARRDHAGGRPEDGGAPAGMWAIEHSLLEGFPATCVASAAGLIVAGSKAGIRYSRDAGREWHPSFRGLQHQHVRWVAYDPVMQQWLAGTEPAGIYRSTDGAESWTGSTEVEDLRDRLGWFLPYSPEKGCVRGFAFDAGAAYAAVEVGGVLSSAKGSPWALVAGSDGEPSFGAPRAGFVRADVHSVETHPLAPDSVWVATDGGVYASTDGGGRWRLRGEPLYTRALCLDPASPDRIVAGHARSVGRGGTVSASIDGGLSWAPAGGGLELPWPQAMVERFAVVGDEVVAVLSSGRVLASAWPAIEPAPESSEAWAGRFAWRRVLPELTDVQAVAAFA